MENTVEVYDQLLRQFQPLIYKTLQRLNIHPLHRDFEDFFQELQIHLLEIFHHFEGDVFNQEVDRYKFTAYASQGLYWHGLNLLRQEKQEVLGMETEEFEWLVAQNESASANLNMNLMIQEFFQQAQLRLSPPDYSLLLCLAEGKQTIQELADQFGVVRDTIYQRKANIQCRLQDLKKCLKD